MNQFESKAKYYVTALALLHAGDQAFATNIEKILSFSTGPLTIRPHVDISERFDDNVFYASSSWGTESDLISIFSPGLKLILGNDIPYRPLGEDDVYEIGEKQESHLIFAYNWAKSIYATHADLNSSDHSFSLNGFYKGNRFSVSGMNTLAMMSGILGGPVSINRVVERSNQNLLYKFDYALSDRTSTYLQGVHYSTDFQNNVVLYDQNTTRGSLGLSIKPFERIGFFGEGFYGQSAISPNNIVLPDGPYLSFMGGSLGIQGQFTPRISGEIKVGYEFREFGNGQPADDSPVVNFDIQYRITDRILATLFYSRAADVSLQISDLFLSLKLNWIRN